MRIAVKLIVGILIFIGLTILTQVGGIAYLISLSANLFINKISKNTLVRIPLRIVSFLVVYLSCTCWVVPIIATQNGRVPLPILEKDNLQPLNILTCILNRNYVRPELRNASMEVAYEMNKKYPGTIINYLDANFPFFDQFPLFPHLSHYDGKKLDLSFCYRDSKTGESTNECPSFIGYGICEEPLPNEENTAEYCEAKGYWQYSYLKKIIPQKNKANFTLDNARTKILVELIASKKQVGKIFIEPHLKTRWKLTNSKIKFHGCRAVRHDDHIHFQLK